MTHICAKAIRELNDRFRTQDDKTLGKWVITQGVAAKGLEFTVRAAQAVRDYKEFNKGVDPWGEHDFGVVTVLGERVFWKISYYDKDIRMGSEDPSDPEQTTRILTIMMPEEY